MIWENTFLKLSSFFFQRWDIQRELYIFASYSIKQHDTVEYLGCQLDSKLNGIGIKRPKENKCQTKIPLSEKHIPNSCV